MEITPAIITMARILGFKVSAEGVETPEEIANFPSLGQTKRNFPKLDNCLTNSNAAGII